MTRTKPATEPAADCEIDSESGTSPSESLSSSHGGNPHSHELSRNPKAFSSLGRLEEDLQQLHSKWQAVEQELHDRDSAIAALELEKECHQNTIAALKEQLSRFQNDVDRHKNDARYATVHADEVDSEKAALRMALQESRDYIDGRKDDWDKLNERLEQYQDTIEGMNESLESHDLIVSRQEDEKAALAHQVMELERNHAELKGRYAEREARHSDLQQTIEEQSRELGRLNSELAKLRKANKESRKKLEHGDSSVSKAQELRIADLESSMKNVQAVKDQLSNEVASSAIQLDEVNAKATERAIRVAELEAMLLEKESIRAGLQKELDTQCELVKALESELANNQESFDSLDSSIDRLSAISTELYEEDQESAGHRPKDEETKHVFVVNNPFTGSKTRYPIYSKEATIGRSSKNNIPLNSKYVSRVHARIRVNGSKVIIEDAGSKNGFRVNSVNSRRHTLKNGDRLSIGSEELRYLNLASERTPA